MADLVLNVQDIDEAGKSYDFPLTREWLAQALGDTDVSLAPEAGEGHLALRAQKQGDDVVLTGRLRAALVTPCSRCLEPAPVPVDAEVGNLFTARGPALRPEPDELELTPEDLDREFFSGDRIVLDDIVREYLLLEVPIQPVCEPGCEGIPVPAEVAGPKDLRADAKVEGVDPRLAPLLSLVGKVPTEE
ncbi:MAG: DUF177 domain-containing protein [Myxococcota bacterium]|nr:DUF177 domain-containing protein [Myxococcota bacterium]